MQLLAPRATLSPRLGWLGDLPDVIAYLRIQRLARVGALALWSVR